MSRETAEWLNTQTLIGYTSKRGNAWHYREQLQGDEPNHYPGPIPVDDVKRRLFDWRALPVELQATALLDDGRTVTSTAPDHLGFVRSDNGAVVGVNSRSYVPHDYSDFLVDNVARLLDADLAIGSAGLLHGGSVAWVQVELEDTAAIEGVEYRPFLTASSTLNGTGATRYSTGAQVVVCDNTLSAALARSHRAVSLRHSSQSLGRVVELREALTLVYAARDEFAEQVQQLTRERVTDGEWEALVSAYLAPSADPDRPVVYTPAQERKAETLHRLWTSDPRAAQWRGTAYGALVAFNTYRQHEAPVRRTRKLHDRVTRNMLSMIKGDNDTADALTLDLLRTVTGRELLPA